MAIINSPKKFKPDVFKLTEFRIKLVMKYVVYCYLEMVKDGKKYDFSKRGKLQQEDFLRNGLVDDYLSKKEYKDHYKKHISDNPLVEIYFQKEENQSYLLGGVLADDYIDISIKETRLSDILGATTSDEIKFAVECKRIKGSSDYDEYIKDIQKFADRPFTTYRLPYEGQIGFIEVDSISHTIASTEINKKLKTTSTITTLKYLTINNFHEKFDGGYLSIHARNYDKKQGFSIFHLFLNYSQIVSI